METVQFGVKVSDCNYDTVAQLVSNQQDENEYASFSYFNDISVTGNKRVSYLRFLGALLFCCFTLH